MGCGQEATEVFQDLLLCASSQLLQAVRPGPVPSPLWPCFILSGLSSKWVLGSTVDQEGLALCQARLS